MNNASRHVLSKLNGRQYTELVGLEDEQNELQDLISSTIEHSEGNSCMVLGPRSSGKTTLVQSTLNQLEKQYKGQFLRVNLSGFVQLDDRMALKEISKQLDAFVDEDNETISERSVNHTLIRILTTFQQTQNRQAVVFVLEELDKFARHARQTLLYNLLDLAQAAQSGIAVIGVSCRMNARDMLEKRVLSRFSSRIYKTRRADSLEQFCEMARANLCVPDTIPDAEVWNNHIDEMLDEDEDVNNSLIQLIRHVYGIKREVRYLNNCLVLPVAQANPLIDPSTIQLSEVPIANILLFIQGLSELELSLLIAAARVEFQHETETVNFNLVYDEYEKCAKKVNMERKMATSALTGTRLGRYRIWSREVAMEAWERLQAVDFFSAGNDRMVRVNTGLLELGEAIGQNHSLYSWTRI